MIVPLRAVERVVCSCFYALLRTKQAERDGRRVWAFWLALTAEEPGESAGTAQLRADLQALGEAGFLASWEHLCEVERKASPGALHAMLERELGPEVNEGLARKARRRGQA